MASENLDAEIKKLIKVYSESGNEEFLNMKEFRQMAEDLYDTLDSNRRLSEDELKNLMNIVDISKDGRISR